MANTSSILFSENTLHKGESQKERIMKCQTLFVEPDLTSEERIERGNYIRWLSNFSSRPFAVTEDQYGQWEWKIFGWSRAIYFPEARELIKKDGFEPAKMGHIFAFGEQYPEEQRKHPIIGLGTFALIFLQQHVPVLYHYENRRNLYTRGFIGDCRDDDCFLGVKRPLGYPETSGT